MRIKGDDQQLHAQEKPLGFFLFLSILFYTDTYSLPLLLIMSWKVYTTHTQNTFMHRHQLLIVLLLSKGIQKAVSRLPHQILSKKAESKQYDSTWFLSCSNMLSSSNQ